MVLNNVTQDNGMELHASRLMKVHENNLSKLENVVAEYICIFPSRFFNFHGVRYEE